MDIRELHFRCCNRDVAMARGGQAAGIKSSRA
jgi:hypothetical protein